MSNRLDSVTRIGLSSVLVLPSIAHNTAVQAQATATCTAQLQTVIPKIIQQPASRTAYWGILIQPLGSRTQPLFSYNADQLFIPASSAKLLTTAAALSALTPHFQLRTPIFSTGQAPVLQTLRIVGQGDPSLSDGRLEQVARQLKAQGVRRIATLIGDDSKFHGNWIEPSWAWEDIQGGDGLPINSLMLNGNVRVLQLTPQQVSQPLKLQWISPSVPRHLIMSNQTLTVPATAPEFVETSQSGDHLVVKGHFRVGAASETIDVPIPQPGIAFLERLRDVLQNQQIQVDRLSLATVPTTPPSQETFVSTIDSPRLPMLMTQVNQKSDNFYAEALLRQLGVVQPQHLDLSTAAQGLIRLGKTLSKLGTDPEGYRLVDGSGLSRKNLVSPRALVQTLQAMAQSPHAQIYRSTLAVAGRSGTLRQRFVGTPVQGNFQGKTGSLQGTATLAGYLTLSRTQTLAISIFTNHSTQSNENLRQTIDAVVRAITEAKSCTMS
jgi:D-alanyl-D-alanine carboxypeptidase/D-alanyl-D-alanine-endopeptidase (penicillin-binding protein 4)